MDAMLESYEKPIARLQAIYGPIALEDSIPDAGRKLFALHLGNLLSHLSRLDEEVALGILIASGRRALRAATIFPIFEEDKRVKSALKMLRDLVSAAQEVQDYQVLLQHPTLNDIPQPEDETVSALQVLRDSIARRAEKAANRLQSMVNSDDFTQAAKRLTKAIRSTLDESPLIISKYEVRHGAPILLHTALAGVRSYDAAVAEADLAALAKLHESLLKLDDTVGYFLPLLGASIKDFEERYATLQESLRPVCRSAFAHHTLSASKKWDDDMRTAFEQFLSEVRSEAEDCAQQFPDAWASFNTRTAQRKFADALLVLR